LLLASVGNSSECYLLRRLFKYLFIVARGNSTGKSLLFPKLLPVFCIIEITLSRLTNFDLKFAFFHSFQKRCTPSELLTLHKSRKFSTTGKEKSVMVKVETSISRRFWKIRARQFRSKISVQCIQYIIN